jgi:hypothetical protein
MAPSMTWSSICTFANTTRIKLIMDKMLFFGPFETIRVLAASQYPNWFPANTLIGCWPVPFLKKNLKNDLKESNFFFKNKKLVDIGFPLIKCAY